MFLQGERIVLSAPERAHAAQFVAWLNDPEVYQGVMRNRPLSLVEEEELIAGMHKRPEDVLFVISLKEGGAIGCSGVHKIHLANRSAELGIVIGEKSCWNRGYGQEAMNLLCRYAFQILNLHRLGLRVYEYNRRAIRCYEKVGFRLEGEQREARFWEGRYWNILEMGILASEWRAMQESRRGAESALCQAE